MIDLLKAVLAGIAVSVGGAIWLSLVGSSPVAGALLFSVGLLSICVLGFDLFTDRAGLLADPPGGSARDYALSLVRVYAGNLIGAIWAGTGILATRLGPSLSEAAVDLTIVKLTDGYMSQFLLAVFCGMLTFIAAECYRRGKDPLSKVVPVTLCAAGFLLAGFEHTVVNAFIYTLSGGLFTPQGRMSLLFTTVGNVIGALVVSLPLFKLLDE
ncbi:MAG: formate/nitrite transporter family protein [Ruminococcaceae bacterium]|jgi:formate/nitrite transporter FocA (FNT family)|nr:formate/nitrite transporter family protein [Oscillospiraceae bacterium]